MQLAVAIRGGGRDAEQIVGDVLPQHAIERLLARARLDREQRAASLPGDEIEAMPEGVGVTKRLREPVRRRRRRCIDG